MRRPIPLKRTNLKAAHFKLIGEITVLSGMIEDTLKRMPLAMLRIPLVPGLAMTAHLKASSLCDMIMAIIPYFIASDELSTEAEEMIALARRAFDTRNRILHGPFDFSPDNEGSRVGYFTARSALKYSETTFDIEELNESLRLHVTAWNAVADCFVGMYSLAAERERLGLPILRPDFAQKASHQTPGEPRPEGRPKSPGNRA